MSEQLLPCPFCGCDGFVESFGGGSWLAGCDAGQGAGLLRTPDDELCRFNAISFCGDTREKAIAAWNRRHQPVESGQPQYRTEATIEEMDQGATYRGGQQNQQGDADKEQVEFREMANALKADAADWEEAAAENDGATLLLDLDWEYTAKLERSAAKLLARLADQQGDEQPDEKRDPSLEAETLIIDECGGHLNESGTSVTLAYPQIVKLVARLLARLAGGKQVALEQVEDGRQRELLRAILFPRLEGFLRLNPSDVSPVERFAALEAATATMIDEITACLSDRGLLG